MEKKEKSSRKIKSKLSSMFELPKEIILNLPLISVIGNEEIKVENYKGVIEYTQQRVRINTTSGILKIEGKNLLLKQITAEVITVTGLISKLEYLM